MVILVKSMSAANENGISSRIDGKVVQTAGIASAVSPAVRFAVSVGSSR